MMVDVHMTDGRTVLRFASRARLRSLTDLEARIDGEHLSGRCWAIWNWPAVLNGQEPEEWQPARVQYVKKHSVAFIRQVQPQERDAFLEGHDPAELARVRKLQAKHEALDRETASAEAVPA